MPGAVNESGTVPRKLENVVLITGSAAEGASVMSISAWRSELIGTDPRSPGLDSAWVIRRCPSVPT